jgi:Na+-translocating ferredoxin:NAD+ oxidoreductase subunit E
LGIFIPLIVVNCIILARAEMFACKNPVHLSILDGFGMGIGFTMALLTIGSIREFIGNGTLFGITLTANLFSPATILILPPGGFLVFGIVIGLLNKFTSMKIKATGCAACEMKCGAQDGCKEVNA